ncbi:MAG: DNA repair protein RecN [Thermodesulfobacteriota bacterium]|nr:DNA repair protein RecN [Thermodesulfobacteriota bacterium]
MLSELVIRNFAIIDELALSFSCGFNVLSGETGAGKSIILNAINLLKGKRTTADIIRSDEQEATVEALFDISKDHPLLNKLLDLGIESEDNLIIKRVISHTRKNKIFINGGLATLGILGGIGDTLITLSGQHENQVLLDSERHIDLLDEFGGLLSLREKVEALYQDITTRCHKLKEIDLDAKKRTERASLLEFQCNEIENSHLNIKEDAHLKGEKNILIHSERLLRHSHHAYETIYNANESLIEKLKVVARNVREMSEIDPSLKEIYQAIDSMVIELEDIAVSLREYSQKIEFDPNRLEEIETRLLEINKLKKKYGPEIDEILQFKDRAYRELNEISQTKENVSRIKEEIHTLKRELLRLCEELSAMRKTAAKKLQASIEKELSSIGMDKTVFEVNIVNHVFQSKGEEGEKWSIDGLKTTSKGIDRVEFLISPNPGEHPRPLSRIASGGELSRVILALKSMLAKEGEVETLIFDEVDAGIGGRVADMVGEKLKSISKFHQVICITHLPQIARFANTHYFISKGLKDNKTVTSVKRLNKEQRVDEIARMLGGREVSDTLREHAREMIEKAQI